MILESIFRNCRQFSRVDGDRVVNVHERLLAGDLSESAALLDALPDDGSAWPRDRWPALRLSDGLQLGSDGGHGPIRYGVREYDAGRRVRFAFTPGSGLDGWHELRLEELPGAGVRWTHELVMIRPSVVVRGLFEPLHDALIEDLFDSVAAALGGVEVARRRLPASVAMRRGLAERLRRAR